MPPPRPHPTHPRRPRPQPRRPRRRRLVLALRGGRPWPEAGEEEHTVVARSARDRGLWIYLAIRGVLYPNTTTGGRSRAEPPRDNFFICGRVKRQPRASLPPFVRELKRLALALAVPEEGGANLLFKRHGVGCGREGACAAETEDMFVKVEIRTPVVAAIAAVGGDGVVGERQGLRVVKDEAAGLPLDMKLTGAHTDPL